MANWSSVNIEKTDDVKVVSHEKIEDTNPEVYKERGILCIKQGLYKQAKAEFVKASKYGNNAKEYTELVDYYNFLFNTYKMAKSQSNIMFASGGWVFTYGWFILLWYMFFALNMDYKISIYALGLPPVSVIAIEYLMNVLSISAACKSLEVPLSGKIKNNAISAALKWEVVNGLRILMVVEVIAFLLNQFGKVETMSDIPYLSSSFGIMVIAGIYFCIMGDKRREKVRKKYQI